MSKLYLRDVNNIDGNPTSAEQTLNANTAILEEAFDNTLSRDGTGPNYMESELDMNSNRIINLGAPAAPNDAARFKDVTSLVTIDELIVPPLDGNEDKYLGTDGEDLVFKEFPEFDDFAKWEVTVREQLLGMVVVDESYPPLNVKRYGALGSGVQNEAAQNDIAFQAVATYLMTYGGEGVVPDGQYFLSSTILFDGGSGLLSGAITPNGLFKGHGAEIFCTSALTGAVFRVRNIYPPRVFRFEGFKFNHRNNSTVSNAFLLEAASHVHIEDCTFEMHNTKSGYASIRVKQLVSGSTEEARGTGSFWTRIEKCVFRPTSGADGTPPTNCIRLEGSANSTTIRDCGFSTGVYGVELRNDGGSTLPNHVLIDGNSFEGINTAIRVVAIDKDQGGYWPTGLKVVNNRFEAMQVMSTYELRADDGWVITSNSSNDHAVPPYYANNWTSGDVLTWIYNPYNAFITTVESRTYGESFLDNDYQSVISQTEYVGGSKRLRFGTGNLVLQNHSNTSNHGAGHIVLGDTHLWYDQGTGTLRMKVGEPTIGDDGVALGVVSTGGGTPTSGTFASGLFTASVTRSEGEFWQDSASVRWARAGDIVVLRIGGKGAVWPMGSVDAALVIGMNSNAFPPECIPNQIPRMHAAVIENNVWQMGTIEFVKNPVIGLYVYKNMQGSKFSANSQNCGWPGMVLTYNLVQ